MRVRVVLTVALRVPAMAAAIPVRAYRRLISPWLPPRCRYHPTCSAYALESLRRHGLLRGSILAAWRLVRCNPWSAGGLDPVSAQTIFCRRPGVPEAGPGAGVSRET